jgi:hypothetical protein
LTVVELDTDIIEALVWIAAPVVTASGFAIGVNGAERLEHRPLSRFVGVLYWLLAGCFLGTAAVYWFGAMLIVAGMLLGGTAGVIAREKFITRAARR